MKNATHIYKGRPVKLVKVTYVHHDQQYCTIEIVNKLGRTQRQTVQIRHLTKYATDETDEMEHNSACDRCSATQVVSIPTPARR